LSLQAEDALGHVRASGHALLGVVDYGAAGVLRHYFELVEATFVAGLCQGHVDWVASVRGGRYLFVFSSLVTGIPMDRIVRLCKRSHILLLMRHADFDRVCVDLPCLDFDGVGRPERENLRVAAIGDV